MGYSGPGIRDFQANRGTASVAAPRIAGGRAAVGVGRVRGFRLRTACKMFRRPPPDLARPSSPEILGLNAGIWSGIFAVREARSQPHPRSISNLHASRSGRVIKADYRDLTGLGTSPKDNYLATSVVRDLPTPRPLCFVPVGGGPIHWPPAQFRQLRRLAPSLLS